jgi:cell fate regulator YaaT (PSP1 superfamily)
MYLNVQIATRDTYKFSTEVYVCKNPNCRHVDHKTLNKCYGKRGLEPAVIEKVVANVVAATM